MALDYDTWLTDLENAISAHIVNTLSGEGVNVEVSIERELKLPFSKPIITLADISGDRENTGGMNVVSDTEQGHWYVVDFFLTINTDDGTGKKAKRNMIWSLLNTITFGKYNHLLLNAIGGISATLDDRGNVVGLPTSVPTASVWYQKHAMLSVRFLVAFTSVTI